MSVSGSFWQIDFAPPCYFTPLVFNFDGKISMHNITTGCQNNKKAQRGLGAFCNVIRNRSNYS